MGLESFSSVILKHTGVFKRRTGHRSYIFLNEKEWRHRTYIFSGKRMAASVSTQKDRVLFGFNTGLKQRDCRSMFPSEKGMRSHFQLQPIVQSTLLMGTEYF